jgi:hypothetical protein
MATIIVMDSASKMLKAGLGQLGFFIQQAKDAVGFRLDQIDAVLVVDEADVLHAQSLLPVELLHTKDGLCSSAFSR